MNLCIHLGIDLPDTKVGCSILGTQHYTKANICNLKKKGCLPVWNPKGHDLSKWKARKPESDMLVICQTCCEYSTERTLSHNENSEK